MHNNNAAGSDAQILKSVSLNRLDDALATGGDLPTDAIPWPIHPWTLWSLYRAASEHARAIHVKAEGGFGQGFDLEADPGQHYSPDLDGIARVDALCPQGAADLWTSLALDWETYGNAFLYQVRDASRRLLRLERRPAMQMARTARGGYLQVTYKPDGSEQITRYRPDEIIHLRTLCPFGGYYAWPAWMATEGMVALADASVKYNASFFDNRALPEYAIITKGFKLTDPQKQVVKTFFKTEYQGQGKSHRTLYLNIPDKDAGDIEFKRITAEGKDGEFLKLLDAAKDRIPIAHGVPPRLLGIVSAGGLGGAGEVIGQLHTFETYTLRPRRRRMIDQCRPLWRELGIDPARIRFAASDVTPPAEETPATAEAQNVANTDQVIARSEDPPPDSVILAALAALEGL